MSIKRMRVFAGPNGSGKTTIIKSLISEIPFGIYVNADDIETLLRESRVLLFNTFQLKVSELEIQSFFKNSQFAPIKRNEPDLWENLKVLENILHVNTIVDSYLAADLAEFIRQKLLENQISFTYETVMSHRSKLDFLKKAKDSGYKIYLYYVATEDPRINVSRVNFRVIQHGHFVEPDLIEKRYYKSLKLLKEAIITSDRAFIWDNSSNASNLFAEIIDGRDVKILDIENVPNWFVEYL
jgi:predicted ABC-type ATPase